VAVPFGFTPPVSVALSVVMPIGAPVLARGGGHAAVGALRVDSSETVPSVKTHWAVNVYEVLHFKRLHVALVFVFERYE
jgi:hypothetical protein